MDIFFSVKIVLIGIVIGVPNLGEKRIFFSLTVKVPGWGHALWAPVTSFEDRICLGLEFMPGSTLPIQAGEHVTLPFTCQALTTPETSRTLEVI
jgi:hypothetical protein